MPKREPLPSRRDINVFDSLDECHAERNFFGKDLAQARDLFRENFLNDYEGLLWMGPAAFAFYVRAAIDYLLSPDANDDTDALNCFCALIEFRLTYDKPDAWPRARPLIRDAVRGILADMNRFGDLGIYGDLEGRYQDLLARLDAGPSSPPE